MVIPFRFFGFPAMYLDFQSFDFERTWWSLFRKLVVPTNLDIYVYITITGRYLCWWIISHRLYQLPNSRCFATDMYNLLYSLLKCTYHQYVFPHENDVRFFFTPLPSAVCWRAYSLLCFLWLSTHSGVQHLVISYICTFWVPCFDVLYDFRIKTGYLCLFAYSGS
jgi:hypothetical protein